ncbi:hypothetical protein CJ030_MR3G019166 [Morella rubra]|uniref:Uncharacterized protein n=1 Tax=Morella rubra TaxID=262757 RepID=A0A6A1W479_9ROSI|nr:hypothetical protein CJ030_MR3G019166 [Morella rubra]
MTKRFTIPEPPLGDIVKSWFLKDLGEKWRNYKCSLKQKFFDEAFTPQYVKNNAPTDVNLEQFCKLVDFWYSDAGRHRSHAGKQNRSLQTTVHTAGSKSFARYAHELRRMEEIGLNDSGSSQTSNEFRVDGSIGWSPSDRYAQVIGPERHGRIRGVGLGPTPSSHPTNTNVRSSQPTSSSNERAVFMENRVQMLESEVASLKSTIQMMAQAWPPLGDIVKSWFLKDLGEKWRNYKCSLKQKFFDEAFTPQYVKNNAPTDVNLEQFCKLVDFWYSDAGRHRSHAGKQNRSLQTTVHTAGSKSFARYAHELEKEKQVPINRADLYKAVHMRSDGSPINPDVAEKIRRMEEIGLNDSGSSQTANEFRVDGSIGWSPSDRYAQVIGPERHGRIRGVGLGPTPSSHPANTNVRSSQPTSSSNERAVFMENRVQMLESEVASLKSTIQMMAQAWEQRQYQDVANNNQFHQQFIDHLMQVGKRVLTMPMTQKVQEQMVLKVERIKFIVICT